MSRSGVSRALRNDPSIPIATCRKVQAVAKRLGFVENRDLSRAFQLVRRASSPRVQGVLAWIDMHAPEARWPQQPHLYITRIFEGAKARALELGYRVEVFSLAEPGMSLRRVQSILDARGVTGLLIPPLPEDVHTLPIQWEKYTAVALTHSLQRPALHRVIPHQYQAASLALHHLAKAGYARIGFVSFSELDVRVNHLFRAAYLSYQYDIRPENRLRILMAEGALQRDEFFAWFRQERPDALLICDPVVVDFLMPPGTSKLPSVGIASLVGGFPRPGHPLHQRVAFVDQNVAQIGRAGVDQLVAQVERRERGVPVVASVLMIEGTWVPGATVVRR